jgi:hypothetical protein
MRQMPLRPENFRHLPVDDFRRERAYLADEVFAIAPGESNPPTDPIDEEAWDGVINLPTDVLLRTTDYLGTMLSDAHNQCGRWIEAMPYEAEKPDGFMFDAALDAADEFDAAPLIAAHGYYRQATAGLRTALEVMTIAAALAVHKDTENFRRWRAGNSTPAFTSMARRLGEAPALVAIDQRLGGTGIFGLNPNGILLRIYVNLCRYAHGQPGHTNVDIWKSNGPVFVGSAFTQFWIDFGDTLVLCYVLYKIGWSDLQLPGDAASLFTFADERWDGLGSKLLNEFFPAQRT